MCLGKNKVIWDCLSLMFPREQNGSRFSNKRVRLGKAQTMLKIDNSNLYRVDTTPSILSTSNILEVRGGKYTKHLQISVLYIF